MAPYSGRGCTPATLELLNIQPLRPAISKTANRVSDANANLWSLRFVRSNPLGCRGDLILVLRITRSTLFANSRYSAVLSSSGWSPGAMDRPSGQWSDDDFDVLAEGVVVGRIFKANAAPVGVDA